jgi:FKBP-type peptidyl-prolyl cis-trans isomerase
MKLHEVRQVCIPPDEGYAQNSKPGIPANSTLIFTLTCDGITAP